MKNQVLAENLKRYRKNKGFSQEQLSDISGISQRTIQRIEKGETNPIGDTLNKLSEALEISTSQLCQLKLEEDNGFNKALSLSALSFIVFPLLGVLLPFLMWMSKKNKIQSTREIGTALINFQLTWLISYLIGFVLIAATMFNENLSNNEMIASLVINGLTKHLSFHIIMYLFNSIWIILNYFRVTNSKKAFYFPAIKFIKH